MKTKPRKLTAITTDDFYEEPLEEPSSESPPSKPAGVASDSRGTAPDADPGAVLIDGDPYWIVQGDLLVDRDEVELYRSQQRAQGALRAAARFADRAGLQEANLSAPGALIGMQQGGKILRWAPNRNLSNGRSFTQACSRTWAGWFPTSSFAGCDPTRRASPWTPSSFNCSPACFPRTRWRRYRQPSVRSKPSRTATAACASSPGTRPRAKPGTSRLRPWAADE